MRPAAEWFRVYAQSHQNPTNKKVHYVCVPLIFWSVLGMLWMNAALVLTVLGLGFYASLGFKYVLRMLIPVGASLGLCYWIASNDWPLFWIALGVFVVAWIGQFIGHHVEGKRPSFTDDIFFLLIGPLWIMNSANESLGRRRAGVKTR